MDDATKLFFHIQYCCIEGKLISKMILFLFHCINLILNLFWKEKKKTTKKTYKCIHWALFSSSSSLFLTKKGIQKRKRNNKHRWIYVSFHWLTRLKYGEVKLSQSQNWIFVSMKMEILRTFIKIMKWKESSNILSSRFRYRYTFLF